MTERVDETQSVRAAGDDDNGQQHLTPHILPNVTLAIGLLGTDFGVLISDTQETFSNQMGRDGAQKLYSVGNNCAAAFADNGANAIHVLSMAHIKDQTGDVDAECCADSIGSAFRGYVAGHGLDPAFPSTKYPIDSAADWQRVLPMTALVCGFSNGTPRLFTVSPSQRYAPTPAGRRMPIGLTDVSMNVLERLCGHIAQNPGEESLLLLGALAIVMTSKATFGVNDELQAVVVRGTGTEVVRQDWLVALKDRAHDVIASSAEQMNAMAQKLKLESDLFDGRIEWLGGWGRQAPKGRQNNTD
jgi:20S proteasome alpha/beta subunit